MRRWLFRIFLAITILIVLAVVATQIILWTDYPRRLVLSVVEQQLGLRVEAKSLSTGWFGGTTLHDVKLSLPLADTSFLDMPRMELTHTWLLPLVLTRQFELRTIHLDHPNLVVNRDKAGRWNLQEVAELIARAGGGNPEPGTKKKPPKLPILRLNDGTVTIVERDGQRAKIEPVTVKGDPDGPLVYHYDIEVPAEPHPRLKAVGKIAPGEDFHHELRFFLEPGEWLGPWLDRPPAPLRINGQWTGLITKGTLAGRLVIEESQFADFSARGRVALQTTGVHYLFNPQNLLVTSTLKAVPAAEISSGTIELNGPAMSLQQIRVAAMGGQAQFDGTGDLAAKNIDLNGIWQELIAPGQIRHSGNIHVTVKSPALARPQVAAQIVTRGHIPTGSWDGQINLEGAGRNWSEMDWLITLPRLDWSAKMPLAIADLSARLSSRGATLTLNELRWPAADRLTSSGQLNLLDRNWFLRLRGGGTIPRLRSAERDTAFDFNLDTYGNAERVHLNELFLHARGVEFRGSGDYVYGIPQPLTASFFLTHVPDDLVSEDELPIRGKLLTEGHVSGTLQPRKIGFTGTIRSENLVIAQRPCGEIHGLIDGLVTDDNAQFNVHDLALFGGQWTLAGVWPYDAKDRLSESESLHVNVAVDHLALKDVGDFLKIENARGTAGGNFTFDCTKPQLNQLAMRGSFRATNVAVQQVSADEITGGLRLRNGTLRVDPIKLRRGEKGTATASIEVALADIKKPTLQATVEAWPMQIGANGTAALWADANLALDASTKSAVGPIKARALFATTRQAIGEASLDGRIQGRVAAVEHLRATSAAGSAEGHATIDADHPEQSNAILTWNGIDGDHLGDLISPLRGLGGKFNGTLTIDPATSNRALAPLRLRVQINPDDAHFRSVEIGQVKVSAFLDLAPNFALKRIVMDDMPDEAAADWNVFQLADGRLKLWARRGRHPGGTEQTHIIADFQRLDLNQLAHAFKEDNKQTPGRLSGEIVVNGDPNDLRLVLGDGHVEVTESDLANVKSLALLYNTVAFGTAPKGLTGKGRLDLSLQHSTLTLENVDYFNRGVEAWASGIVINDVWRLPHAPLHGYVVGSARPLSALKIPFLADADKIMSVLQSNLTTVKMEGYVDDYKATIATFSDVSAGLKQLLSGKVNETHH